MSKDKQGREARKPKKAKAAEVKAKPVTTTPVRDSTPHAS
jgi:hypothetical protein